MAKINNDKHIFVIQQCTRWPSIGEGGPIAEYAPTAVTTH